jgi:hypothetical protein
MPLRSDFKTFPLPDLFQWIDSGRQSGVLFLEGRLARRLRFYRGVITGYGAERLVETTAPIAVSYGLLAGTIAEASARRAGENFEQWVLDSQVDVDALRSLMTEETQDLLFDVITDPEGEYEFRAGEALEEESWIPIQVELRGLLLEAMRHLDERPQVERLFGGETAVPRRGGSDGAASLKLRDRRLLGLLDRGMAIGEMRWTLKTSSLAIRRRLFDLARSGYALPPSGEVIGPDPIGTLISQGLILLRERQFNEVAHVFESLLGMDQADSRVREFLRHIEQEHVGEMYLAFSPLGVPEVAAKPTELSRMPLRPEDRALIDLFDGKRDVARIVTMSPLRELNTLKGIQKLEKLGAIRIRRP